MSDVQPKIPSCPKPKRTDSVVLSLREELQLLYKSLQHKNDELIILEKTILERDISINGLKKENQHLISVAGSDKKLFSINIESDRLAKQNEIAYERSDSLTSGKITNVETIHEQNETIKELNEKIIRLSRHLSYVQRNLQAKEELITELHNEIDKFRQIVRPITQKMLERRKCDCFNEWNDCISGIGDWSPGIESTRVFAVSEPRIKRQAISAEPLSALVGIGEEDGLIRIPKSSL